MPEQKRKSPLSIPPPDLGRSKVGRYEVICPMAQGGMANIYVGRLASMAGFERLVAIKVIHPRLADDPAFISMFLDEARLAAGIHHPNVGEIFEVGEDDGLYFMVGELIKGQSLRALYRRAKRLEIKISHNIAAYIASKVCLGAHAAHELRGQDGQPLNLIHRDISPRNILISYDGFVKLIDFGVAWAEGRDAETSDGDALRGKIGFMPPEQIKGEPPMDRRSDLFSLGIVMYMMVTGAHPFSGKTEAERLQKMLGSEVVPPRKLNPSLDPVLERIVLTALSPSMADRYENAEAMGQAIDEYLRRIGKKMTPTALSDLMIEAFADEMQAQEELLRQYRRKHDDLSQKVPLKKDRTDQTGGGVKPEDPGDGKAAPPEAGPPAPRGRWPWVAGALALVTAFVLGMLLARPAPEKPARESIRVVVEVHPDEATVKLDGRALAPGSRNFTLPADGSAHALELSAKGYATVTESVLADRDLKLTVYLKPL